MEVPMGRGAEWSKSSRRGGATSTMRPVLDSPQELPGPHGLQGHRICTPSTYVSDYRGDAGLLYPPERQRGRGRCNTVPNTFLPPVREQEVVLME